MAGLFGRIFGSGMPDTPDLTPLGVDIHSHLIPGIDDGAKDMEMSLEMIRGLAELGITKVITTPHIMSDGFPNTPEIVREGLGKLQYAVQEAGISVAVEAAAEYYLDEVFERMIGQEELLTFGGEARYVLFETSYVSRPMSLESVIFKLKTQGYTPVLAHPERYNYFWDKRNIDEILELVEIGTLLQVNLASLAGNHSKRAAKIAMSLIEADSVDFLGSDIHRPRQLASIKEGCLASRKVLDLINSGRLHNNRL